MRNATHEERIAFDLNKARLEAQRQARLYDEFIDQVESDPDFNYSIKDFSQWLIDYQLSKEN